MRSPSTYESDATTAPAPIISTAKNKQPVEQLAAHRLAHRVGGDRPDADESARRRHRRLSSTAFRKICSSEARCGDTETTRAPRLEQQRERGVDVLLGHAHLDALAHAAQLRREALLERAPSCAGTPATSRSVCALAGLDEVLDRALVADPPARDDRDAVAHELHVVQDVRVHEHGLALLAQAQDQVAHLLAPDRVEPAHRLVEEHDVGVVDERLRDPEPLLHALAVGAEARVRGVRRGPTCASSSSPRARRCAREQAAQLRVEVERLAAGEIVVEVGVLGQEADVAAERGLARRRGRARAPIPTSRGSGPSGS